MSELEPRDEPRYYADSMRQLRVEIVENVRLARDTYRVRFHCPEIAQQIVPGQFVMLRLAGFDDPLIGRPLALYDTVARGAGQGGAVQHEAIDVVYLVKGKFTTRLARLQPGQQLEVWGPLGNGFPALATNHLILVAGGIGQTPMLALAREYLGGRRYGQAIRPARADRVSLCYGARSAEYLAGIEDFQAAGVDLQIATDDGSRGRPGLVTALLAELLNSRAAADGRVVMCCGPEPMMAAVAELCERAQVPCYASLETPMACGIGICFTCVARVRQPEGGWDYRRTCVEGPVFAADRLVW